jgi:hypothetical protein
LPDAPTDKKSRVGHKMTEKKTPNHIDGTVRAVRGEIQILFQKTQSDELGQKRIGQKYTLIF